MAELLLELLSEEIPARMQARAAEDLERLVTDGLTKVGLDFSAAESFATPRRLALVVDGLPEQQPDVKEERKGPRVGSPDQAINGFLKSAGLKSLDQCEIREVKGNEFYFAVSEKKGGKTAEILPGVLLAAIGALAWPKSMRWGDGATRYVRPLHSILAVFNGKFLKGAFDLGGAELAFGAVTHGHRFLAPKGFRVTDFADYHKKLRNAFVILDAVERREIIASDADKLAAKAGLRLRDDPGLLDEVAGLVEWPVVLLGGIDAEFMDVPPEILTTAMRSHQKYFALEDKSGNFAPNFIVVANMTAEDGGKAIVAGNERVLRARLSDARFFWDQDRKATLASRVPALNDVVFHAKLGSLGDKVDRVAALAVEIAGRIPGADTDRVRSAARLAKADLTTEMVGEFPELQGVMGRYYAAGDGENEDVATAIAEHYSPLGPTDVCPTAPVSVAVALADKIDTLVGFWAIDEKPTGSKDPYALRRAAQGVIRLILENGLRLHLSEIFKTASASLGGRAPDGLMDFFADRLKVHLRAKGVRHDFVSAVFALGGEDDLVRLMARVEALGGFVDTDDGANLLTAYGRAANIVRIEEKKDAVSYAGVPDAGRLEAAEEEALNAALTEVADGSSEALAEENFAAAMSVLARLRGPVDAFFDKVTVNTDDKSLRENRLRLLSQIRDTMDSVADFSQIEG